MEADVTALVASIISCAARTDARSETIPQLQAAGLEPTVFLSPCDETHPAGGQENALVSARALQHALDAGADLLFCEDDIDLAPDFPRFLALARESGRPTYLYLHDVGHYMADRYGLAMTHAILRREPIPAGLYELRATSNLCGAQCVYLPLAFLRRLSIPSLAAGPLPIDRWLTAQHKDFPLPPLVALPHPVQHRQVRVARAQPDSKSPDKYSRSFDLERRWA